MPEATQPMKERRSCRVCRSSQLDSFFEKNGFPLGRCAGCGLVQVLADLADESLEPLYGQVFFEETYDWLLEEGRPREREYAKFNHRLDEIEKFTSGR